MIMIKSSFEYEYESLDIIAIVFYSYFCFDE